MKVPSCSCRTPGVVPHVHPVDLRSAEVGEEAGVGHAEAGARAIDHAVDFPVEGRTPPIRDEGRGRHESCARAARGPPDTIHDSPRDGVRVEALSCRQSSGRSRRWHAPCDGDAVRGPHDRSRIGGATDEGRGDVGGESAGSRTGDLGESHALGLGPLLQLGEVPSGDAPRGSIALDDAFAWVLFPTAREASGC